MTNTSPKSNAGFTLIELTVVACIFALFAAMGSSVFRRSFVAMGEEAAMQDLFSLMTFARERAILERVDYGIHLSPKQNAYWLVRGAPAPSGSDLIRIPGQWGQARALPSSLALLGDDSVVIFYPNGTATPAVVSFTGQGHRLALSIDPVTGKGDFHESL